MSEEEIVDVLDLIIESIVVVQKRFAEISDSDSFSSLRRFAFLSTPRSQALYSSTVLKSELLRNKRRCFNRRFKAPFSASTSPFCSFLPTAMVRGVIFNL